MVSCFYFGIGRSFSKVLFQIETIGSSQLGSGVSGYVTFDGFEGGFVFAGGFCAGGFAGSAGGFAGGLAGS